MAVSSTIVFSSTDLSSFEDDDEDLRGGRGGDEARWEKSARQPKWGGGVRLKERKLGFFAWDMSPLRASWERGKREKKSWEEKRN